MKLRPTLLAPALLAPLLLIGCGSTQSLKPAPGQAMPVAPYGASDKPAVNDLLTPSTQARPRRNGSVMTRSQERQADEFDLPPR